MKVYSPTTIRETYEDVSNLLDDIVNRFIRQYGGDFSELRSEANEIFMQVYQDFDHKKGRFTAMLGYIVFFRLVDSRRVHLRKKQIRIERDRRKLESDFQENRKHFYENFIRDLSADAITVVELIFCPPREIVLTARTRFGERNPRSLSLAVKEFLYFTGWTTKRIYQSFSEVREAICDDR